MSSTQLYRCREQATHSLLSSILLLSILVLAVTELSPVSASSKLGRRDLLDNDDGTRYTYCEASHPQSTNYPDPRTEGSQLVNVQLVIRHGDRTPLDVYPQDHDLTWDCNTHPAFFTSNSSSGTVVAQQVMTLPQRSPFAGYLWRGSCSLGQLTPKGAAQQQRMGHDLRGIYVDRLKFLPETFDPSTMRLRSTDVWRTRQSAENLMIGLYGNDALARGLTSPTFQIETLPAEIDYLTFNTLRCPRIQQLVDNIQRDSKILRRIDLDQHSFQTQLSEMVQAGPTKMNQMSSNNMIIMEDLVDAILPRVCHGFPLQCDVGRNDDDAARNQRQGDESRCITAEMADECLIVLAAQNEENWRDGKGIRELLQLGIGSLTGDIRANLQDAVQEPGASVHAPFRLYSAHDTTILPLLGMLDSADMRWPPYASNLVFELWKSPTKEHFVRVLYNGRVVITKSNWCDLGWCPLDIVLNYLGQFVVDDDLTTKCEWRTPE